MNYATKIKAYVRKQSPRGANFIKKETLAQGFSYEFCEISKNTFSYKTHLVAASVCTNLSQKGKLSKKAFRGNLNRFQKQSFTRFLQNRCS